MNSRTAIVIGFLALGAACRGQEQPKPASPAITEDAALLSKLEVIDKKAAAVTDLAADFEQQKFTPLLKQPLASSGTIKVKGATARWDTTKPEPSVMRIDDRDLRIYYPTQRVLEVYPLGDEVRKMTASPLPRLATIRSEFSITETNPRDLDPAADPQGTLAIKLSPRSDKLKEHIASVRVLLDAASGCALKVEIIDPDDERTVISFKRIKINPGLKDSDLELRAPEGAKIVHPLPGAAPPGGDKP